MAHINIKSDPVDTTRENAGLWPLYVFLITGFALTGLFPWLMVSRALYQRERRDIAIVAVICNVALFVLMSWILLKITVPWWWLVPSVYLFNIAWSCAAWLFQGKFLGPVPTRYVLSEWKGWMVPISIGVLIGVCLAIIFSIPAGLESRTALRLAGETLERKTILWEFFQYSWWGIVGGLLLGLWWAGEHKRFRTSNIVTFLSAFVLTLIIWSLLGFFLLFFIYRGPPMDESVFNPSVWATIPPWSNGVRKLLAQIQIFNVSALLVIPLLFGAVSRIRDFGKRIVLIVIAFFCVLPMSLTDSTWWDSIQGQIIYEMSSSNRKSKAIAHGFAGVMLKRYPNHLQWPRIAYEVSHYYDEQGEYKKARYFYQKIIDRYSDTHHWYWVVKNATAAIHSPYFGKPSSRTTLEIPLVDYERYLTHNWMAFLSVIRYWEGSDIVESQIKIRLKNLSRSDDKILLSPLETFADLDDAARNLNYKMLIFPADLAKAKDLIAAGIPFIHQHYTSFNVIFGFDESRSCLCSYSFAKLSKRIREEAHKETREILAIEDEGRGKSKSRLARIANEAYDEYSFDIWKDPFLQYGGPLMAVVFPPEKGGVVSEVLERSRDALQRESDGYVGALIALSYIHNADPLHAVEWAKIGAKKTTDPLPLYVAHLAEVLWKSRGKKIKSTIPLQKQFSEVSRLFAYFKEPGNRIFLSRARQRFEADLNENKLPWFILDAYIPMLERSDPRDLALIIQTNQDIVSHDPTRYRSWQLLARSYEWIGDIPGMIDALQGAISAHPFDSQAKLQLAYALVLHERYADAEAVLDAIDISKIMYEADYPFCLGAIAEWQGAKKEALRQYGKAVEMRCYKPLYHLRYGKMLLQEGRYKEAQRALEWAARIDAGTKIEAEAKELLSKMGDQR